MKTKITINKICLFILCILPFAVQAQPGISWQPPMNIGSPNFNNQHPRLALDGSGNPMVVWGDAPNNKVWFSRWNGTAFTVPVNLNPASIPVFAASWAGPEIGTAGDTVYVVFKKTPESVDTNHIYLRRSFNGGQTFDAPVRVDYIADSISRFPAVIADASGNPVVTFMKFDPGFGDARWVATRSNDFGGTFQPDVPASGFSGGEVCDCCPATMTASGNTMAVMYRDNLNNLRNSWAGISTDGGASFGGGIQVDQTNWVIASCPASGPDGVIVDDTLVSVYMSGANSVTRVYMSLSSLSGLQYLTGWPLAPSVPGLSLQNYVRVASAGAAVAIVWKQLSANSDVLPILFTANLHLGLPGAYDTVVTGNPGSVVNTDVALSADAVHVVWEDNVSGHLRYRKGFYLPTGIDEAHDPVHSAVLYPNPASEGPLTLWWSGRAPERVLWNVYDPGGRCVAAGDGRPVGGRLVVDPGHLAGGLYHMQLIGQQFNQSIRFSMP